MANTEKYTLHSVNIKPYWNFKAGQDPTKLIGKIIFNDENQHKAFEINIDDKLAKEIVKTIINQIGDNRSGSIINLIKEKFTLE